MYTYMFIRIGTHRFTFFCIFTGKQWVWNGGFSHLMLKAEIMGGVVKFI